MRYLVTIPAVLILAFALSACGERSELETGVPVQRWNLPEVIFTEDGRPDPSILAPVQVLHRGNGTQPQGLDPHITEGVPSSNIQRDLFEGLLTRAADSSIIPGVAERWEVSEDGFTWTFFLRENARWSNGDLMTADDWLFSFRRIVNPATGSRFAILLNPILHAEDIVAGRRPVEDLGVRVIDDFTLEIDLEAPNPLLAEVLTHSLASPVHRPSVEAHGDRWARPGNMVSNGAYMLEELAMQSHIRLVRNPYYWDNDNTIIDEVFFYPTEDLSAELMRYRAGELSWTYEVPNTQFNWIQANLADELVADD
ncbi:MAG: peptide ABC transporter substrate-binding protein, partial [Wenzhouxiangellaceae bacterium]